MRCCPLAEWRGVASDRLLAVAEDGRTADRTESGSEALSEGARRSEPALFFQSGSLRASQTRPKRVGDA